MSRNTALFAVSALGPDDAWAVGWYTDEAFRALSLAEHWDGTVWSVVETPNGPDNNLLYGVAAISADDVWAVGYTETNGGQAVTLALHWDGARWTRTPTPNGSSVYDELLAVSGSASDDVWASGYFVQGSLTRTLVEHWDGSSWAIVPSATPGTGGILTGAAADPASGDWVVGYSGSSPNRTLVERWDGARMAHVDSDNPPSPQKYLYAVSADNSGGAWAVGNQNASHLANYDTLIEHWDGSAWAVVDSPSPAPNGNSLLGVASVSSTEAWAVGYEIQADYSDTTLVEQWDGAQWTIFPSPNHGGSNYSGLAAMSAPAGGADLWAVGAWYDGNLTQHTLVEHYCG